MGLKAQIKRHAARHILSLSRRDARRRRLEKQRLKAGHPHRVEYFHDASDPYSHLMVQLLPEFAARYEVEIIPRLVPPPPDWAAPDRDKLVAFARQDGERLARRAELDFIDPGSAPTEDDLKAAQSALLVALDNGQFFERAAEIGAALWAGNDSDWPEVDALRLETALAEGDARREELGHYLGGMLFYAEEWYWGPDRLHFLEQRLNDLGATLGVKSEAALYRQPELKFHPVTQPCALDLHWYLSFRSPYSAITVDRVKALADHYGANLKIRYVLPMVSRGMNVPRLKRMYIVTDVVREADRLGIPFGDIVDPLGAGVERGYAVLDYATEQGLGFDFVQSFYRGVWSDGIDASTDKGLKNIAERAGLNWAQVKAALGQEGWRKQVEENRAEMYAWGFWGVPSFRLGDFVTWGQDRLWLLEEELHAKTR